MELPGDLPHHFGVMRDEWKVTPLGTNAIRAWRLARGFSQEELVDRVRNLGQPFTTSSLSRIERGDQPYNQRTLEALAKALGCEAADLLSRNPIARENLEMLGAFEKLPLPERHRVLQIIRVFAK